MLKLIMHVISISRHNTDIAFPFAKSLRSILLQDTSPKWDHVLHLTTNDPWVVVYLVYISTVTNWLRQNMTKINCFHNSFKLDFGSIWRKRKCKEEFLTFADLTDLLLPLSMLSLLYLMFVELWKKRVWKGALGTIMIMIIRLLDYS